MPILGANGQLMQQQVPLIGQPEPTSFVLPVAVMITPELKKKLVWYTKQRGIDGQSLVLEIVMRGLGSLGAEIPYPLDEAEEPKSSEPERSASGLVDQGVPEINYRRRDSL